jgi:putative transposase
MPDKQIWPNRKVVRLEHYDYSKPGYYFVTICVQKHHIEFGQIVDDCMQLNETGRIIQFLWERLPSRFSTVQLDAFVIMPNHLHGIIELTDPPLVEIPVVNPRVPARFQAGVQQKQVARKNFRPTLGKVVRDFKAAASYEIHRAGNVGFSWLRNYYESVVRDEQALEEIRNYIINNPATWAKDKLHR